MQLVYCIGRLTHIWLTLWINKAVAQWSYLHMCKHASRAILPITITYIQCYKDTALVTSITKANMFMLQLEDSLRVLMITQVESLWPWKIAGGNNICIVCDTITIRLYLLHYPMPAWRCLAHSPNITLTTITTTNSCTSQLNRLGRCKQYQGLSGKIWSQWRACTISFLCTVCVYNGKLQSPGDTFVAVDDCNIWQVSIAHRIHYVCILCMCNSCSCKLQHTS